MIRRAVSEPAAKGSVADLLGPVRRRLRVSWALATLQILAPFVALAALLLVVVGRLFDVPWAEPAALLCTAGVALAVVVCAAIRHVPTLLVARAADRGLDTRDAFATSLELSSLASSADAADDDFCQRVHARAEELAHASTASSAVRYRLLRRPTGVAAILAPAALALALIANPQDTLRDQRAQDRAQIAATADVMRAEATRLAATPDGAQAAVRLKELADELSTTSSLEKADELLDEAAAELRQDVGTDLLTKRAATEGLARSLESAPLPGASSDQSVQEQLDALQAALPTMTAAERADAAQRLENLAATQEAGDPATAAALGQAAQALTAGDAAGAQAALGEAGAASGQAAADANAQAAASDAAQSAAAAADRLAQARDGTPQAGQGAGSGTGTGSGSGQGSGSGSGQGSGSGSGSGQGAGGSPSGNVQGGSGSAGTGGQGGKGTGTGHTNGSGSPNTDTIFDPVHGTGGETGTVGGGSGSGQGGTIGTTNGQTNNGSSNVPVADVIDDYTREATAAMNNPSVPPSVRALVLAYFNQLQGKT